jgi:hypothetical protein
MERPGRLSAEDESFMRKFTLPIEDRLVHSTWPQRSGGHRWFRSANVVDLQNYRSSADKARINVRLLFHGRPAE